MKVLTDKPTIVFLNDKVALNALYRSDLMSLFQKDGYNVISMGLENILKKIKIFKFIKYITHNNYFFISSNLRSNIFLLLFYKSTGVIILNGLGRNRRNKFMRKLLILLIILNKRKFLFVQNYSDFRYIKRFAPNFNGIWILGSGGTKRKSNDNKKIITVQRDSKINFVENSISDYLKICDANKLFLVGCKEYKSKKLYQYDKKIISLGYVNQDDIFMHGSIFLQPYGYGEGFPHTLADAFVSDLEVHINKRSYISYGLYKLNAKKEFLSKNWIRIHESENIKDCLKKDLINEIYIENIKNFFK